MGVVWNETNSRANGGTELQLRSLEWHVAPDLLDQVHVIPARGGADLSGLDPSKPRILWCQDPASDPMTSYLSGGGWEAFDKIVFASHHQQQGFLDAHGIPHSRCAVLRNAIVPIDLVDRPDDGIVRIVYTPTPHRGLDVLLSAFMAVAESDDRVHLDVYSSFKLYGWGDRDAQYEPLFDACRSHPQVTYHGSVPNDVVRQALQEADVFAYPSTWVETSCVSLMEAMSANCLCLHSNLGALYETGAGLTMMYPYDEDRPRHAGLLVGLLRQAVESVRSGSTRAGPSGAKTYADHFYSWELRALEWTGLIRHVLSVPRQAAPPGDDFVYRVN